MNIENCYKFLNNELENKYKNQLSNLGIIVEHLLYYNLNNISKFLINDKPDLNIRIQLRFLLKNKYSTKIIYEYKESEYDSKTRIRLILYDYYDTKEDDVMKSITLYKDADYNKHKFSNELTSTDFNYYDYKEYKEFINLINISEEEYINLVKKIIIIFQDYILHKYLLKTTYNMFQE